MHVKDLAAWYEARITESCDSKKETREEPWDVLAPHGTVNARRQQLETVVSGESFHGPPTSSTISSCGASSLNDTDPVSDPDLSHVMCILPSDTATMMAASPRATKAKPPLQHLPTPSSSPCKRLPLPCDAAKPGVTHLDENTGDKGDRRIQSLQKDDRKRNYKANDKNDDDSDDDDDDFLSDLVDIALVGDVDDSSLSGSDVEDNDQFNMLVRRPASAATPSLPPAVPTKSSVTKTPSPTKASANVTPSVKSPPISRRASPKNQSNGRPKSVRAPEGKPPLRLSVDAACRPRTSSSSAARGKPSRVSVDGSRLRPSRVSVDAERRSSRHDESTARSVSKRHLRVSVDAAVCRDVRSSRRDQGGAQRASVDDLWSACMSGSDDGDSRPSALSQDSGTAAILRQRGNDINIAPNFHSNRAKSSTPALRANSRDRRKETNSISHHHHRKSNQKNSAQQGGTNNNTNSVPMTTSCAALQRLPKAKVLLARKRPFSTDGTPVSASPLHRLLNDGGDDRDGDTTASAGTTPRRLVREYSHPRELLAGHVSMVTSLSSDAIHKKSTVQANNPSRSREKEAESVALRRHAARHPSGDADGFPSVARSKERYNRRRGMFASRDADTTDIDGVMAVTSFGVPAGENGVDSNSNAVTVTENGGARDAVLTTVMGVRNHSEDCQSQARPGDRFARAADRAVRAGAMISGTVERVSMAADPWIEFITDGRPVAIRCSKPTDALRRVVRKLFGRKTDPRLLNTVDNE